MQKICFVLVGLLTTMVMRAQLDSVPSPIGNLLFQVPAGWKKIPATTSRPGPRQPGPARVNTTPVHPIPGNWLVDFYYPGTPAGQYITLAMRLKKTNEPLPPFPDKDGLKDSLYRGQRIKKEKQFDYRGPKLFDQMQMLSSCEVVNASADYVFFEYKKPAYHYYMTYDVVRLNDTLELLTRLEGKVYYDDIARLDDTLKTFTASILAFNENTFDRISKYRPKFTVCTDSFSVNGFWIKYPEIPGWKTSRPKTENNTKLLELTFRPEGFDDCYPKEITVTSQSYDYSADSAKLRRQKKVLIEKVKENKFLLPPKLRKLVLNAENPKAQDSLQSVQHWYVINAFDLGSKAYCIDSARFYSHMIGVDAYSDDYHKMRITFRITGTYEEFGQVLLNDQLFMRFVLFIIEQNDFEKYYSGNK